MSTHSRILNSTLKSLAVAALALFAGTHLPARAQDDGPKLNFIRDAETEHFLRKISNPLFAAAGLDTSAVHIYLLNETSINAFVAGGQNMFMHTGTITSAQTPNELSGVIAHETGHIAGGHITRTAESIGKLQTPTLLGVLLGIGVMAAGAPQVGAAIMTAAQTIGMRNYLSYTRAQESSADQAAVRFLSATKQSGQGLLNFFDRLHNDEIISARQPDPYAVSHPLSGDRIASLQREVQASAFFKTQDDPQLLAELQLIQGKIHGFLEPADVVMRRYPVRDTSAQARYARAAAYYRRGQLDLGLAEINSLIKDNPKDAYFFELKGQMLFESGKVSESVEPYRTAAALAVNDGQIHAGLGQSLIAAAEADHDPAKLDAAITALRTAIKEDDDLPIGWRRLAEAYAAKGNEGMANLATAEFNYAIGNLPQAGRFALRAREIIAKGTVSYNRANDIVHLAQEAGGGKRARAGR